MDNATRTMKVINGKSIVLTMPSIIAIMVILVGMVAAYFTTYSDLRAEVSSQGEKIKSQEKYFEKEFERVNRKLDDIERLLRNERK
jgi:cell division protein FtsL